MKYLLALRNLLKQRAKDFPVDLAAAQLQSQNRSISDSQ